MRFVVSLVILLIGNAEIKPESIIIIAVNFVVMTVLFTAIFKKKGLE